MARPPIRGGVLTALLRRHALGASRSAELAKEIQTSYASPDAYPLDGRSVAYHFAFFSAKHFGAGQFYLFSIKDGQGEALEGASDYRLTVPADVPVNLYWSATIYDRETHTLIRDLRGRAAPRTRRGSRPTPTARSRSSSDRNRRPTARRTGSRPSPAEPSRSSSASTDPRSPCSTRAGNCRTSKEPTPERPGAGCTPTSRGRARAGGRRRTCSSR